jgi:hypothetical protein
MIDNALSLENQLFPYLKNLTPSPPWKIWPSPSLKIWPSPSLKIWSSPSLENLIFPLPGKSDLPPPWKIWPSPSLENLTFPHPKAPWVICDPIVPHPSEKRAQLLLWKPLYLKNLSPGNLSFPHTLPLKTQPPLSGPSVLLPDKSTVWY